MKINVKDVEQFIVNVPKNIRAILFYGPDVGLIKTRVGVIEQAYNVANRFKYDQVKSHPSIIFDNLRSISLFGEDIAKEKLVTVEFNSGSILESLAKLITEGSYKGLLLFYAGDLGPDSSLRKYFEKGINTASIPCYVEDRASVVRIIEKQFKLKQITHENNLPLLLVNYIPLGNHELILRELEKIFLFLEGRKHVLLEHLEDYLELQGEVTFDRLCYQVSLKQPKDVELLLFKLQNEGHNIVSITRMIMRHFNRLYQVKLLINQGKSEKMALDSLVPSVFFKQENDFCQSLKLWSEQQLMNFLKQLNELELMAKQNAVLSSLMIKKLFISFMHSKEI